MIPLLTQKEAAALLNVSISTIKRLRQNGDLATIKTTKRMVRISQDDVFLMIKRAKCQNHSNRECSQTRRGTITSTTIKMDVPSEIALGRKMYRLQHKGFKGG
jgi:excisionase family DNA binding protein